MKTHLSDTEANDYLTLNDATWIDRENGILRVDKGSWHPASGIWKKETEKEGFRKVEEPK